MVHEGGKSKPRPAGKKDAAGASRKNRSLTGCALPICNFNDQKAPRLYVNEHIDGAGHRLKNIVDGIAVAKHFGLNFAGALPLGDVVTEHGHNFEKVLDGFFGPGARDEFILPTREITFAQSFKDIGKLELWSKQQTHPIIFENGTTNIYLGSANAWAHLASQRHIPASEFYPDSLRRMLGQYIMTQPVDFSAIRPSVAIHIRRGDLRRNDRRALPNEYFLKILQTVQNVLPNMQAHIWSSIENTRVLKKERYWNSSDFDDFRAKGVHVHLDDESLLTPWVHMAKASIFLASESAFSLVPAYLNLNCVIFHGHHDHPLPHWVDGLGRHFQEDFKKCVERLSAERAANKAS